MTLGRWSPPLAEGDPRGHHSPMASRSSADKLKPLPPDPDRHQHSAISRPAGRWIRPAPNRPDPNESPFQGLGITDPDRPELPGPRVDALEQGACGPRGSG